MTDLEIIKDNGLHLRDVYDQTLELCMEAVKQDGLALEYVKSQTPEICMVAVKQNGMSLKYVKSQTPEICMEAVKQNGWSLQFVKTQTQEMCIEAVKQKGILLGYFVTPEFQTPEVCMAAVCQDGDALKYVESQTPEICMAAVKEKMYSIRFVKEEFKNNDMYLYVIKKSGEENNIGTFERYFSKSRNEINKDLKIVKDIINGKNILDTIIYDISFIQFIENMRISDYHKLLDHILESEIELTDYQKEHLERLESHYGDSET